MEENLPKQEDKELIYHCTNNYDQFKFFNYNRTLGSSKHLKHSIEAVDLTPYVPILVTPDMYIIDGQNRFNVCKELGMPIHYIVYDGDAETAMVSLNTVLQPWRLDEWLHYYVEKGYPAYVKLNKLMKEKKLGISNAILLFSQSVTDSRTFKKGTLKDDSQYFIPVAEFLEDVELPHSYKYYRAFVHAVMVFIRTHENEPKLIKKLQKRVVACPKYTSLLDYTRAFENLARR